MEIKQFTGYTPPLKTKETSAHQQASLLDVARALPKASPSQVEPQESFTPVSTLEAPTHSVEAATTGTKDASTPSLANLGNPGFSWQQGEVTFQGVDNGPIASLFESPATLESPTASAPTMAQTLASISANLVKPEAQAMQERENSYLKKFPHKDDAKALKARGELNERYHHPSTSAESMTKTISNYAEQRGVSLDKAPEHLTGELDPSNLKDVKGATQKIVDQLFLNRNTSFNIDKHATVSKETSRFLDLAMEAAPSGFTAADAYKLVAGNLALISYQDKAAAENMLGDHGVRHLLGHNIKACEQLADGLEGQGVPVSSVDRLVMHQAMIVHDLGYAMDSVRGSINANGLRGQDAGHNVLAARYLRERSQNPDDPVAKLFGQQDLERMHRCVLFHDKDANGGPGVNFQMTATPSAEDRATNLETMTRVADNSHAFEDKLPELLYREPSSFKTLRLMKTAGELGDGSLVDELKGELADHISAIPNLAKDDKEALLMSTASLNDKSYKFSVGRIAGNKPSFDISPEGKVMLTVSESDTHQATMGLFGMESYNQMEKFIKDCTGEKVKLSGQSETISGQAVDICFQSGPNKTSGSDAFNEGLASDLRGDAAFVSYALLDSQLSQQQEILGLKVELGALDLSSQLDEVKAKRRALLDDYRVLN